MLTLNLFDDMIRQSVYLEVDNTTAMRVSAAMMDSMKRVCRDGGVSVRELNLCTGLSMHLLCDRGRNIRFYSFVHLCRFVARLQGIEFYPERLIDMLEQCMVGQGDLVARRLAPGEEPSPGEEYLLRHK